MGHLQSAGNATSSIFNQASRRKSRFPIKRDDGGPNVDKWCWHRWYRITEMSFVKMFSPGWHLFFLSSADMCSIVSIKFVYSFVAISKSWTHFVAISVVRRWGFSSEFLNMWFCWRFSKKLNFTYLNSKSILAKTTNRRFSHFSLQNKTNWI